MRAGWNFPLLKEITEECRGSAALKDTQDYELWSVPSFSTGRPEIVKGSSILSAKRPVEAGDVLLCKINPRINRVWVVGDNEALPKVASTEWILLRPRSTNVVSARWLQLYLSSSIFRDWIVGEISGATGSHTRAKPREVMRQRIPLPPLPEQKRIVAILDDAFAGIATAVANTEKNLTNARELFESYLTAVFEGLEEECKVCALSDLGRITSSKRIFKSEYTSSGIPFFRTKEIKQLANGKPITTELFISEDRYNEIESSFGVPRGGDLLMTAIGTIGEIYVKKEGERFYFKDGNVLWLKDFREINPYFLKYMLRSFVENLKRLSHGAAYNALPIEKLKGYEIPVPSLTHQERLLDDINEIESSTKRLELVYQQKLNALTELKQSLLQKAFCGELTAVPQEEIETALA